MAVATTIFRILLLAVVTKTNCDNIRTYNNHNSKAVSQFGELLKPPPPPLSKIIPVPFHGGVTARSQRQTFDAGYHYQPPPPPPPPALPVSTDFKFPAPFYKQYNFNFVPSPQPFTTTPSPSLFQKVSGWLFSSSQSPQSSYGPPVYNTITNTGSKKDCNPCNLVPWIPVIRYDLEKQIQSNLLPTYGPPSPTANVNFQNIAQYHSQPFQSQQQKPGIPHAVYGPPPQNQAVSFTGPSSTYGPPSPTHSIISASPNPLSSTYSADVSSSFGIPSSSLGQQSNLYGVPSSSYGVPSSTYSAPIPSSSYGGPSSTYGPSPSTFGTPSPIYETPRPATSPYELATTAYPPTILNNDHYNNNGISNLYDIALSNELQLPKVTHPSGFKNSYGEPITNTNALDIPYSVSATAAESTKIQEEIVPNDSKKQATPNSSLALSNPAPFTLNRGRNIHTLQPVALPNLSVSPLPPIFNARPFRPLAPQINTDLLKGLNYMQQNNKNNINIEQSLPVAEFTQSIDYSPTVIKSPVIDIDALKNSNNQTKAYRNLLNGFTIDEIRDISSQASEDHLSATKTDQDVSFETTGSDFGNYLYDTGFPADMKSNSLSSNHKSSFADLRGIKDEDVDKFRTENNLQNIDSPLLYLKPSAPHKDFSNFILSSFTTPSHDNSYEIYDEIASTSAPQQSTQIPISWDDSKTDYNDGSSSQVEESKPKIVQIIVPYTTGKQNDNNNINFENIQHNWANFEDEYQGRKVPSNTEMSYTNTPTNDFNTVVTEEPHTTVTEYYDSDKLSPQAILNDLYDVKEPPFDIIKLQHTIDDWTQQEYTKEHKSAQKARINNKYAKQIPDEYFTTINPISYYNTGPSNNNYEFYDHEGASSNHHSVTEKKNITEYKPHVKDYNSIERTNAKHDSSKNEDKEIKRPHIYTAASSFRVTTTTSAPWGKIQTSISPLTKEKVYVVTSKPWRDVSSTTEKNSEWYDLDFEFKKTARDSDESASGNLSFQSPRFSNRPSIGFLSSEKEKQKIFKHNYDFSKSLHQSINDLEGRVKNSTSTFGGSSQNTTTINNYTEETTLANTEEDSVTITMGTAERREVKTVSCIDTVKCQV